MTLKELQERTAESLANTDHSVWDGVLTKIELDIPTLEEAMLIDGIERWLAANEGKE